MKLDKKAMLLYAVTDRLWSGKINLIKQVELALKGGITCLQLREKMLDENLFLKEAKEISSLCKKFKVPFIVNDNVNVAIKSKADGIHVGQEDMEVSKLRSIVGEHMIIGVSVHSVNEALEAVKNGADYIGVGAVFPTSTKNDVEVLSREVICDICSSVNIPVVAIGGIKKENIMELSGTGIDGVALVSAIFSSNDIERECILLRKLSEKMVRK